MVLAIVHEESPVLEAPSAALLVNDANDQFPLGQVLDVGEVVKEGLKVLLLVL